MPSPLFVAFAAGPSGFWRVDRITAVAGEGLPEAARLTVFEGAEARLPDDTEWVLRGTTSNSRYTNRPEILIAPRSRLLSPARTG